jgi:hypothetical protein
MADEGPFVAILKAPRETIRRIVDDDPARGVNALLVGAGAVTALQAVPSFPQTTGVLPLVTGALQAGLLFLVLGRMAGAYQRWIGDWFGGVASRAEVRAAVAWGAVPWILVASVVAAMRFCVFGADALRGVPPNVTRTGLLFAAVDVAAQAGVVWSACVMIACYAEVNRFSVGRSVAAAIVGAAIVCAALVIVWVTVFVPLVMLLFYMAPPVGVN